MGLRLDRKSVFYSSRQTRKDLRGGSLSSLAINCLPKLRALCKGLACATKSSKFSSETEFQGQVADFASDNVLAGYPIPFLTSSRKGSAPVDKLRAA
jgi:hypothetical protein